MPAVCSTNASPSRPTFTTRSSTRRSTPTRTASASSASSTVRARLVSGKSLPSSSSCSDTPSSSKNATARSAGNARRTLRIVRDDPPEKSRSLTTVLVTLQRAPPLTRIFAPTRRAPSRHDDAEGRRSAAAEYGCGEAGCAAADDHDVCSFNCSAHTIRPRLERHTRCNLLRRRQGHSNGGRETSCQRLPADAGSRSGAKRGGHE